MCYFCLCLVCVLCIFCVSRCVSVCLCVGDQCKSLAADYLVQLLCTLSILVVVLLVVCFSVHSVESQGMCMSLACDVWKPMRWWECVRGCAFALLLLVVLLVVVFLVAPLLHLVVVVLLLHLVVVVVFLVVLLVVVCCPCRGEYFVVSCSVIWRGRGEEE